VPITISKAGTGEFYLRGLVLTPATPVSSDVGLSISDLAVQPLSPTEGDPVLISATLHNDGSEPTAPFVASFLHGDDATGTLLGGAFVDALPAGGDTTVSMPWDTTGYTGTQTLTVIADPNDHLAETDEGNNQASTTVTVLTKPDLRIPSLTPSETELVEGQSISVTAVVSNTGQTAAPASTLALYAGTVATGTLIDSAAVAVSAGTEVPVDLSWTAATVGPQLLSGAADTDGVVLESREDNNEADTSVYVGWGSPVYVDAGGDPDPIYAQELGYGLISESTTVINTCGTDPAQTYRQGTIGQPLEYRFDHLLPSHYYHLDTTMSLCGGQRTQHIWIDGLQAAGPLTVTASAPLRHSLRLDPASYVDHSVIAGVTAEGFAAPAVAELTLTDIHYCYRDCGSTDNDPPYSEDNRCGYYDPSSQGSNFWGEAPTQTVRVDLVDSDVVYRFSGLDPARMYAVNLTFFEGDGAGRQETVRIDGATVGPTVTLSSEPQYLVVPVPVGAYETDGTVDVAVVETTGWNAPVVSEIAIEEQTVIWWDDDLDGPAIAAPTFSDTVPSDAPLLVTVDIRDQATGGNGVSQATLYFGYDAPYDQNQVPGTGPGGNGDGSWTFEIPAQGAGHEGQTLWFWITARDGDDSPATSTDTNGGTYYAVSIAGPRLYIYLPLLVRD
jgi:hypothetical protein